MEQDVHTSYSAVCCSTCLSTDRYMYCINETHSIYQVFRFLMHDFETDRFGESVPQLKHTICWECEALMKKFGRFKRQVHTAQERLRILAMSRTQESMDHKYMPKSLSSLKAITYIHDEWPQPFVVNEEDVKTEHCDVAEVVRENLQLNIDDHILEVPELVLENPVTGTMSRIVVGTDALVSPADALKREVNISTIELPKLEVTQRKPLVNTDKSLRYFTDYMTEGELIAMRSQLKNKVQYVSSAYKCELCIIGFYSQQQAENHFLANHSAKPGKSACQICSTLVEDAKLSEHTDSHYIRYKCKLCGHIEYSVRLITMHVNNHTNAKVPIGSGTRKRKKKATQPDVEPAPKPGDLRKLLSKKTIEGYQCLECDMFFKNSRLRKTHVARCHSEGFQCDHCKKRFVNKTTLATHLRLHEGPLPREECPICHKMVRVVTLKYHIRRHQNKKRYECTDCNKTFLNLATYQGHLKYSRAHAADLVFKFPCPICNKGCPTKEAMQDHFNFHHLAKTSHKCPVCDKPIASQANVKKHMMRMHGQKTEKPRNHVCQICGKAFTDKKALNQHEVVHSGERPLTCDICQQTFKQKPSLYTHRKKVHNVFNPKRMIQYLEPPQH